MIVVLVFGVVDIFKVDKIFGLGNVYVVVVKVYVMVLLGGFVVDLFVGLSEVMVVVDVSVNVVFVVSDFFS